MFTRQLLVAEIINNYQNFQWNPEKDPSQYNFMKTIDRTFIIPSRQNQFIREHIFIKAPMRKITVAMNTHSDVARFFHENFINYQLFYLRKIKVIPGGTAVVSLDTTLLVVIIFKITNF